MKELRSARWFEVDTRMGHTHRQRIMQGWAVATRDFLECRTDARNRDQLK